MGFASLSGDDAKSQTTARNNPAEVEDVCKDVKKISFVGLTRGGGFAEVKALGKDGPASAFRLWHRYRG